MFDFLKRKHKSSSHPAGLDRRAVMVFEAAREAVFTLPREGTMLHSEFKAYGPAQERQGRFEVAAYVLHSISMWCQIGYGSGNPDCATLPSQFFTAIHTKEWFGGVFTPDEIGAVLSDRDQVYFAAYKDGEAKRQCEVLTAILSYALKGGHGLIIFHDRQPFDPKEIVVEALNDNMHMGALIEATEMPRYFTEIAELIGGTLNKAYRI